MTRLLALLATSCIARPMVVHVEWPKDPAPADSFPAVCLPDPLSAPPEPLAPGESDSDLLGESFARQFIHHRDLDPLYAYAREMAAQVEDMRVCIKLLEEQHRRRRTGGTP